MDVVKQQLDFYRKRRAGCIFAAACAHNPKRYGWAHVVIEDYERVGIGEIIAGHIALPEINILSLVFPNVSSPLLLQNLIDELSRHTGVLVERTPFDPGIICYGIRVRVGDSLSWVSGFGNFSFLPKTRQAPYTEIVFRTKPRPNYERHMKAPIQGVVHLADTYMIGTKERIFKKWWNESFSNTKRVLGHTPNLLSAAKTTFAIPEALISHD